MAKPPPIVRCKITCSKTVEITDLGPTMLTLTGAGFDDVHYDFVSDVDTYRKRVTHEVSAPDYLREWIKDHASFTTSEFIAACKAEGRTTGAGYTAIRVLIGEKLIKRVGTASYVRTDVKRLAPPNSRKGGTKKLYDPPNFEFLLRTARRNHGKFSSVSMCKAFEADGRPAKSVGALTTTLANQKLIKRTGPGQYVLLQKATKKKPAKKKDAHAASKANGNGQVAEIANG
jgi:hypothetical protein